MELKKYYDKLYLAQDKILNLLAKSSCYLYLTGGTALHRFVLEGTRYSDDIDLFTGAKDVSAKDEMVKLVRFLKQSGVVFDIAVDSSNFKRLIVKDAGVDLKIDIVYDVTEHIGDFDRKHGFLVDNIENILVNKYDSALSREQSRDIFDIYTIIKNKGVDLLKSMKNLSKKSASEPETICARIKSFPKEMIEAKDIRAKSDAVLQDFMDNYKATFDEFFDSKKLPRSMLDTTKEDVLKNTSEDYSAVEEIKAEISKNSEEKTSVDTNKNSKKNLAK